MDRLTSYEPSLFSYPLVAACWTVSANDQESRFLWRFSEMRGNELLRTVQLERATFERLRALAIVTKKPVRWHMERAIQLALGNKGVGYHQPDFAAIARGTIATLSGPPSSMAELINVFYANCDANGVRRPHLQTVRKHLRVADAVSKARLPCLIERSVRNFDRKEDSLILKLKSEGKSLSDIGALVNRRANVVLRRLRALDRNNG
jgi:hypothetical protein